MNFESVRSIIDTYIKKNGVEAITGDILNNVLNTMLDDVDTAISSIEPSPGGGSGEGGVSEEDVLNILEKNNYITSSALSSYYTKAESDAMYLASSLLGSNTLIHSGNIGSYAFVPKSEIANNTDADNLLTNGVYLNATGNGSGNSNFPQSYSIFATFAQSENYLAQLSIGYNSFYFRRKIDTWDEWREVIHSGNIGSYAMRWLGNDGYRDLNTFSYDAGVFGSFYSPNAPSGLGAYAVLNLPYRRNAEKPDFMAQILIPNGDDADTNMYYRTSLADSWNPWRKVISTADDGYLYGLGGSIDIQYGDEINRYGGNLYLQHRGGVGAAGSGTGGTTTGHILMCAYGGNVLIGTAVDSGYKLDVYGDSRINGNLIVSGDFSFGSDMRFKDKIEDMGISIADIAKAPLFTYKWKDRDDDVIYLGSSAQYWEKIAPWLVSGDDFKSLNYATLGVAMGISLAKKTINHEERIKILETEVKRLKREQYGSYWKYFQYC